METLNHLINEVFEINGVKYKTVQAQEDEGCVNGCDLGSICNPKLYELIGNCYHSFRNDGIRVIFKKETSSI